jgi:hypothetical protein
MQPPVNESFIPQTRSPSVFGLVGSGLEPNYPWFTHSMPTGSQCPAGWSGLGNKLSFGLGAVILLRVNFVQIGLIHVEVLY